LRNLAIYEHFIAVVVTHELNLASELADELILMECGRCLAKGSAEQVLQPELLRRVFRTPILVDRNPSRGRPRITWVAAPA
jgi:iron complex transport system ATP-binding protein